MEARLFYHFIIRDRNDAPLVILLIDPFFYLNDALVILGDLIIPLQSKKDAKPLRDAGDARLVRYRNANRPV